MQDWDIWPERPKQHSPGQSQSEALAPPWDTCMKKNSQPEGLPELFRPFGAKFMGASPTPGRRKDFVLTLPWAIILQPFGLNCRQFENQFCFQNPLFYWFAVTCKICVNDYQSVTVTGHGHGHEKNSFQTHPINLTMLITG